MHINCHIHLHGVYLSTLYSAKTKDGVQEAFDELVHKVFQTPSLYTVDGAPRETLDLTSAGQEAPQGAWCGCTLT